MPIIVFAVDAVQQNNDVVNAIGIDHRLISFWYLKDKHPDWLKHYVQGLPTPKKERIYGSGKKKRVQLIEP